MNRKWIVLLLGAVGVTASLLLLDSDGRSRSNRAQRDTPGGAVAERPTPTHSGPLAVEDGVAIVRQTDISADYAARADRKAQPVWYGLAVDRRTDVGE